MVETVNWNPIADATDRWELYNRAAAAGEAKSRVHHRAMVRYGIKSIAELTLRQCQDLTSFYYDNKPVRPRPRHWNLAEMPRADVSKLGYVRWPLCLAEADLPAAWKLIDLKLLIFITHKMNLDNPWAANRCHWKEAREFVGGATKSEIQASLDRLMLHPITSKTPVDLLYFSTGGHETYAVLQSRDRDHFTGIDGQEMCWNMEPKLVSDLADFEDGYGRIQLETIRKLKSFAAIRIYLRARMIKDSLKKDSRIFSREEMARFMGCAPDIRIGNLKTRNIEPAIDEIKAAGEFVDNQIKPIYGCDKSRCHAITSIRFEFVWGSPT